MNVSLYAMPTSHQPSRPRSADLYALAADVLPGANSRTTVFVAPHPPYAARGDGYRLWDVDDHVVLDLQNNYTSLIHGHAQPRITEAVIDAAQAGASYGLPTRWEVDLATELGQRVAAGERWRFANSGTEAVMIALRAARAYTGKPAVLRFTGAYHGSYDAVVDPPARGVAPGIAADLITVPVGDRDALDHALDEWDGRLACVLFDAMPNRAGLRPAEPDFVEHLRAATADRGILLVQDEVLTFRISRGGLHECYGITPDLVTLGKVIGGGFPVGAIGGRADVMAVFDPTGPTPVAHGGTFSANPVTMRAGLAALQLWTDDAIARLNALGETLRSELLEQGWTVTGRGSLMRIHVTDREQLWWSLYDRGVLIAANGLACLSTPMDEAVITHVGRIFAEVRTLRDWT